MPEKSEPENPVIDRALDEDRLVEDLKERGYGLLVTRKEMQEILSVSRRQALTLIRDQQVESLRLNHHYRVPTRSIARYIALGATPPKPTR